MASFEAADEDLPLPVAEVSADETAAGRADVAYGDDKFSGVDTLDDDVLADVSSQNDEQQSNTDTAAYRSSAFGDTSLGQDSVAASLSSPPAGEAPPLPSNVISVLESLGVLQPVR